MNNNALLANNRDNNQDFGAPIQNHLNNPIRAAHDENINQNRIPQRYSI